MKNHLFEKQPYECNQLFAHNPDNCYSLNTVQICSASDNLRRRSLQELPNQNAWYYVSSVCPSIAVCFTVSNHLKNLITFCEGMYSQGFFPQAGLEHAFDKALLNKWRE
jgi:hypothetical protein